MFPKLQSWLTAGRRLLTHIHSTEYNSSWNTYTCTPCPSLHPPVLLVPFFTACHLSTFMSYLQIFFNLYSTDESKYVILSFRIWFLSLNTMISSCTQSSLSLVTGLVNPPTGSVRGHLCLSHPHQHYYCLWRSCLGWGRGFQPYLLEGT